MHTQVEQQLAYVLLVELLSYQFAFPVQWIETQNVLLSGKNVERVIEVGPSDTLVGMIKKTLARQYKDRDAARYMTRKLLYYSKNSRELQYELDAVPKPARAIGRMGHDRPRRTQKGSAKANEAKPAAAKTAAAAATPAAASPKPAAPTAKAPSARNVSDAPISAKDVVVTIIAQKLKKSYGEIPAKKTIKQLAGGRSTLENEIVGDLDAEFGSIPERSEDIELDQLCATLQASASFSGQMGKTTTTLTSRLFATKMPGGFSIGAAREHLQARFGLGPGRQDSVFVRATAATVAARLASAAEAESFFDGIAQEYAADSGLDLSSSNSTGAEASSDAVVVDSKALSAVTKDQEAMRQAKLELYAKFLRTDLRSDARAAEKAQKLADQLQGQLDSYALEMGDVFLSGLRTLFAAPKIRRFDSSWNWVLQDALELFHSVLRGSYDERDFPKYSTFLANRSSPRLIRMMKYLLGSPSLEHERRAHIAKDVFSRLIQVCGISRTTSFKPLALNPEAFTAGPSTTVDENGVVQYKEVRRSGPPLLVSAHIRTKEPYGWVYNKPLTGKYLDLLQLASEDGLSFSGKYVLATGAGPGSIGAEILKGLLCGGARVIVTTSSYSSAVVQFYQEMYVRHGSRDSELIVAPFNQGSQQDVEALVQHIFDPVKGLGWDLDHVLPFAAISVAGREIDAIDSKSELALRIMLTNTIRLLGAIKRQKESRGYHNRQTQVILPLSPNHGNFGNDGLYGESKIALETLFEKWHSESWSDYLSICGAVIGWTRGTGLMADNNVTASGIEKYGVRTFSQAEMAFYILGLMSRKIATQSDMQPLYADLTGGLNSIANLKTVLDTVSREVSELSDLRSDLAKEKSLEQKLISSGSPAPETKVDRRRRANIQFSFPTLPDYEKEIEPLARNLVGMADLDRIVVIAGFSEVGPWGNARTRWEMEAYGKLSLEGCIQMAWIMGLITNHNGPLSGEHYTGWIDTKTKKPVHDVDIKPKYEAHILSHSGIRFIEPSLDEGYRPEQKQFLQEIILEEDLPPFVAAKELADQIAHEHGDKADIYPGDEGYLVRLKKGATMMVPKAIGADRTVAGQVPTGWDARTYGISDDIITQVDRATLFTLVSTVEALISSGITDPYELYKYIHVSEIGNCIGSGLGGVGSLKRMFKSRYLDKSVQNDVLQETFINTTAAWVNMLLISSSGPIRTPVGACATSIESLETGFETIVSGKAKMCLVGGYDDMTEAVAYEFANMKATSNSLEELEKGRLPEEMSRPFTKTRSGFMESQGSGVQVLTSARLALDMGLPINGVVAWVGTASDKIGRSVPAPGQGILTNARENLDTPFPPPLLDVQVRRRRLQLRLKQIQESVDMEIQHAQDEQAMTLGNVSDSAREQFQHHMEFVLSEAERQKKEALNTFGNEFWKNDPRISPIRGALSVFGLTIDDLDFASFHGTSTVKNDQNETNVIQHQLTHLGRKQGNTLFGIGQKYLTGHSKGAAGAWMLNGCLQVLDTGLVPGNRNADNIDPGLDKNDMIVFPNRSIQTSGVKAFSLTSFGFGQKGAQVIGVHPRYLHAMLTENEFAEYKVKVNARHRKAFQFYHNALATNTMFVAKDNAPYTKDQEAAVLLNPEARVSDPGFNETEYSYDDALGA
ncbi:hypothetical protein AJ80_03712 [Polytolypa hystricis UAMH7299]|uniref:Ketosynthase family 3 (KS3) domain-containing protein n=1 Tax=Polytolypa hystricis (strain UAMH7299) TaxID=1447883 RepID=A0A2B7YGP9_POLH7|nr:hypothetical protein AJ80_03712 [Polytolypa hystricis UAMH7299]